MKDDPRLPPRSPGPAPEASSSDLPPRRPATRPPLVDFSLEDLSQQVPAHSPAPTAAPQTSGRRSAQRVSAEPGEGPAEVQAAVPQPTPPQAAGETPPLSLPPSAPATAKPPRRPRRGLKPGWLLLGLLAVTGLVYLSWAQVPVKTVEITGNTHLPRTEVRRLAGLPESQSPFGWLYYGAWKAQGLLASPWILTADVTRKFPDTVQIALTERSPFARWKRPDGAEVLVSEDGTVLPRTPGVQVGDPARLPLIDGWGPSRLNDALRLTRALSRYTVQSVTYTPAGFTAKTAGGTAWGGDLETFVKYAGSIGMYPNKQIHIYPWGVSVQE